MKLEEYGVHGKFSKEPHLIQIFIINWKAMLIRGLLWWLSSKASTCQWRRHGFNPWIRKIPWRRKWQPTPVLLPGKSHGWRSLVGYSPWGRKESDMTERLHFCISSRIHLLQSLLITHSSASTLIRSDQISHSVVSDYLWPHESQHARPPCPSLTPGVHWDSRPSSQRCH